MRSPRLLLAIGLLLAGVVVSVVVVEQQSQRFLPLTSYSSQPDGARALALWLEALGYRVEQLEISPYQVEPTVDLLFVLEPTIIFDGAHLQSLESWVRGGRTLVVAGNDLPARLLLERLGIESVPVSPALEHAAPAQPLFGQPIRQVALNAPDALRLRSQAGVPLLADGEHLLGASLELGEGRVVALASPHPFTNAGLPQADNAAFVLDLVAATPPGSTIAFDEYHHGFIRRDQESTSSLLLGSTWGRTALYAGLLALAYLALSGRRFGRPVPLGEERRRSAAEYVRSMASLYRRANQQAFIARHHAQQVRRRLARDLGLDPAAPLADLRRWLDRRGMRAERLLATLERLETRSPRSDRELLDLIRESDEQLCALLQSRI